MIYLTEQQENKLRVTLFKARYKTLKNEGLSSDERFAQAIIDTSDDKIVLEEHSEIVRNWLYQFNKKRKHI